MLNSNPKEKSQTKSVEIVPDISLMKKMANISGTVANRVMELVDNSIDARIEGKKLEVDVNISNKRGKEYIEILDNGTGMDELTARSFFRLGDSKKEGENKIGRFGLGSKVAIIGLGDSCTVETTPAGESYQVVIRFNVHDFNDWKIDYDMHKMDKRKHGTKIKIENLTVRIGNVDRFVQKIAESCAKSYKHFIKNGDVVIRINGEKLVAHDVELVPGLHQEFDFEINGKRVHGWAGAMVDAGTNWDFGFDLINQGRVIKSRDLLSRQAHTSLARLTGEIHLDDFKTDIHKTDFIRHDSDFEEMQEHLIEHVLKDLIAEVSQLTSKEVFTRYEKDIFSVSNKLNRIMHNVDFLNNIELNDGVFKKVKNKRLVTEKQSADEKEEDKDLLSIIDSLFREEEKEEAPKPKRVREKKRRNNIGLIIHDPLGISAGEHESVKRWYVEERENGYHLHIEVNVDHPAYRVEDENDVASFMKNTIIDSVAEFVLEQEKQNVGFVESEIERLNRIKDLLFRYMSVS